MIYFSMALIAAFGSVPLALTIVALRRWTVYGLGWSISQVKWPVTFWLCVGAYVVIVMASLFFFLILFEAAFDPRFR
jgi:hypothetical protein